MVMLVRSPEAWFRKEKRELPLIALNGKERELRPHHAQFLIDWFRENCPATRLERLGPSEHSGIIEGGCHRYLAPHFAEGDRERFEAAWLDSDGNSRDPRFQFALVPLPDNPQDYAEQDWVD